MRKSICKEDRTIFISLIYVKFCSSNIYNNESRTSRKGLVSVIKPFVLKYNGAEMWGDGRTMLHLGFLFIFMKEFMSFFCIFKLPADFLSSCARRVRVLSNVVTFTFTYQKIYQRYRMVALWKLSRSEFRIEYTMNFLVEPFSSQRA